MPNRKIYTPELAMRSLPLVRRMAEDLRDVAEEIRAVRLRKPASSEDAEREADLERRLAALMAEFDALGIEVKDPFRGLIDFRARRGQREVYLCWCLGEDRVSHWHELDAGFSGRQPIEAW
jgi:hypothetical protein